MDPRPATVREAADETDDCGSGSGAEASPRRRRSPGRLIVLVVFVLSLPCAAPAQSVPIPIPKNVILPNYDNVFIGSVEALEAGAYLARTDDATASFYNPAGLAAAAKTSVSASADGFYWTQLTSRALGQTISTAQFASTPGHFAFVLGLPFIESDRVRLGFSITKALSWTPAGTDHASQTSPSTTPSLTYSSRVDFSTVVPAVSLGYRVSPTVRLGVSTGVAYTSYSDQETLSGELALSGEPSHFLSTLRASGSIYHLVVSAGAQWDVTSRLKVGALARAPGLPLLSRSRFTYESAVERPGAATWAYFRDEGGAFRYKLPLEVSAGAAYRLGPAQAEIDVRYHRSAGQYTMYRSAAPLLVQARDPSGQTTTSTEPFPAIPYSSRQVVNVAGGANYRIGRLLTFHGGWFISFSPIGDPAGSPFQKADLYGGTLGAAVSGEHWSFSAGLAYQVGHSASVQGGSGAGSVTDLDWRSLTLLYALAYRF
jgi:hypothetical protein